MVGKSVDKKEEIRAYIKARTLLGCSLKDIFSEIKVVYGNTVELRWLEQPPGQTFCSSHLLFEASVVRSYPCMTFVYLF